MRRIPRALLSRRVPSQIEPLEGRQLLAAELVSVNLVGTGPGNGASSEASVSGDGRYVVFVSTSSDLVAGDTNNKADVFLRDRHTNSTTLVSRGIGGAPADAESFEPKINNDSTFVVFATRAGNIIAGDKTQAEGGNTDVVRYNIASGALELVSVRTDGGFPGGGSGEPTISADGRFVAFTSFAGNLGASDANSANDVYLRDMTKTGVGAVTLVSVALGGNETRTPGDMQSFDPQVSDNGNFVSFRSDATNLVANDANAMRDTFVRNVSAGTTTLVSVTSTGVSGNAPSESNSISGNGGFVAFRSAATDLVSNDTNNAEDIFLRNLTTNQTTLLSINQNGTASARGQSRFPWLSADASTAVFSSSANDLIGGDVNNNEDVFLRDLQNGPIYILSTSNTGTAAANGASFDPYVSRDGKFIVFTSEASDVSSTADGNGATDVFITVAPNNPGDPGDPDPDPTPGPGPSPGPNPNPDPGPTPPPDPNPDQPDTTPPVVSLPSTQPAPTQGNTEYQFNVNLADERALNTIVLGDLVVTRQGGTPQTATLVNVVGSGRTAQATYRITFANPLSSADNGTYTVDLPANAVKDAAGNAAPAATLGTIAFNVGSPNDPDLTAELILKPSTKTIITGPKARGTARVKITNAGQTAITRQNVPVTLYLSDNPSRDAADIQLGTVTRALTLKTGKAKTLPFRFIYPQTVGTGSYFLIAEADTGNAVTEANESNNISVSPTTVSLAMPFTDLRASIDPVTGDLRSGGRVSTKVNVINDGNVRISNNVTIRLVASTDNTVDASDQEIAAVTRRVSIRQDGAAKAVRIRFTLPTITPGTYSVIAIIDPLDVVDETSESNNFAVTAGTVNIA